MEQTPFALTPKQKGMLASLLDETGQPVPTLVGAIAAALEELQERQRLDPNSTPPAAEKPIWEIAEELFGDIPDEELARLPVDGAAEHDHYLYGWPKRSP